MTSRFAKPLLSALALVAALAALGILFPIGAVGSEPEPGRRPGGVTAFNRAVHIGEPLAGDVQVLGGDVVIESAVQGNVVVLGGDVEIRGSGRIDGDLVCLGGVVKWADRSALRGEVYAPRNGFEAAGTGRLMVASMRQPFSLLSVAMEMALLAVWFLVSIIVVLTNGPEVRASSLELRASTLHIFLIGLVAFTSFMLTAVVFSYLIPYVVGLLLLFALLVFATLAKVYGMVAVFHALGTWIAGPRTPEQAARRRWLRGDLAMVVVGFLVLGLIRLIPLVGPLVWMAASALAIGVALATKFGRREPWFLTWRPAEA